MPAEAAQRILDLLDHALPAPRRGTRVLDRALQRAGLKEIPLTTEELKAFVRTAVRETLEDELGPRLALEVARDLDEALSPALRRCETLASSPSSRRMRRIGSTLKSTVLVVGGDRLRNATVARVLLRHGFVVTTAQDLAELAIAVSGPQPDAVVLDERCALDPPDALVALLEERLAVVHNCSNPALAETIAKSHGASRVVAVGEGAPSNELVYALSVLFAV